MKQIDFILKNFQASAFLSDIKNGGEGWCEDEVAVNYKDYNDIRFQLSYLKYFKGNLKDIPFKDKFKKAIINFFNKKKELNLVNIEKFFYKNKIFNLPNAMETQDYGATGDYKLNELIKHYIYEGIFFQKIKEFSLIYRGYISYKSDSAAIENDQHSVICFYSKTDKKYHLLLLFLESDGNDSYDYIRSFNSKPSINDIKISIKKKPPSFYTAWYKFASIDFYEVNKKIKLSKFWLKELKSALNFSRQEKPFFSNEKQFLNFYRGDIDIEYNYVIKDPIKYFKNQNPLPFLKKYWQTNKMEKIRKFKFFNYIMTDKFNYKHSSKFIFEILHLPDDLEGLLNLVPSRVQQSKMLAEEIRILRMLRSKNKKFLVTVFNKNKDKLYDLALNYMPKNIFDDPFLVMKMVKIDPNIIDLIGKKLKKNKKFMKQVWKD